VKEDRWPSRRRGNAPSWPCGELARSGDAGSLERAPDRLGATSLSAVARMVPRREAEDASCGGALSTRGESCRSPMKRSPTA
jgi:hypothetical protein